MSEKFSSFTPYNYCVNNPINVIDPDGNLSMELIDELMAKSSDSREGTKWENKGNGNFEGNNGAIVDAGAGGGDDDIPPLLRAATSQNVQGHVQRAAAASQNALSASVGFGIGVSGGVQVGNVKVSGSGSIYNITLTATPAKVYLTGDIVNVGLSGGVQNVSVGASGSMGNWSTETGIAPGLGVSSSAGITVKDNNASAEVSNSANVSVGGSYSIFNFGVSINPVNYAISVYELFATYVAIKAEEIKMGMEPQKYFVPSGR